MALGYQLPTAYHPAPPAPPPALLVLNRMQTLPSDRSQVSLKQSFD